MLRPLQLNRPSEAADVQPFSYRGAANVTIGNIRRFSDYERQRRAFNQDKLNKQTSQLNQYDPRDKEQIEGVVNDFESQYVEKAKGVDMMAPRTAAERSTAMALNQQAQQAQALVSLSKQQWQQFDANREKVMANPSAYPSYVVDFYSNPESFRSKNIMDRQLVEPVEMENINTVLQEVTENMYGPEVFKGVQEKDGLNIVTTGQNFIGDQNAILEDRRVKQSMQGSYQEYLYNEAKELNKNRQEIIQQLQYTTNPMVREALGERLQQIEAEMSSEPISYEEFSQALLTDFIEQQRASKNKIQVRNKPNENNYDFRKSWGVGQDDMQRFTVRQDQIRAIGGGDETLGVNIQTNENTQTNEVVVGDGLSIPEEYKSGQKEVSVERSFVDSVFDVVGGNTKGDIAEQDDLNLQSDGSIRLQLDPESERALALGDIVGREDFKEAYYQIPTELVVLDADGNIVDVNPSTNENVVPKGGRVIRRVVVGAKPELVVVKHSESNRYGTQVFESDKIIIPLGSQNSISEINSLANTGLSVSQQVTFDNLQLANRFADSFRSVSMQGKPNSRSTQQSNQASTQQSTQSNQNDVEQIFSISAFREEYESDMSDEELTKFYEEKGFKVVP